MLILLMVQKERFVYRIDKSISGNITVITRYAALVRRPIYLQQGFTKEALQILSFQIVPAEDQQVEVIFWSCGCRYPHKLLGT